MIVGFGFGAVTRAAYDLSGVFLGSVTSIDDKPLGDGSVLALSLSGIHSVVLSGTSGTVGFDNFEFNIPLVPEPNAWVLLIAGLGWLFGYSKWQSKHSGDV